MRKCIKCGQPKPLWNFGDTYFFKQNTCLECKANASYEAYAKKRKRKLDAKALADEQWIRKVQSE